MKPMPDSKSDLSSQELIRAAMPVSGATAYPPLPIDPFEERGGPSMRGQGPPGPRPQPSPLPGGPAYPPLPVEPDTRDGKPGQTR
jgi:hypothetical protein